jgi:uncharacterized metal-binding protein
MPNLPKKKVGIVACSGEELPEGTVTRLAALKVLEQLRPGETVTICLPLFLAGGQGDRGFARFYPTIAVDGCEVRCAARATEMYSGKLSANLVVSRVVAENGLPQPQGLRRLNAAGMSAVDLTADQVATWVDELLGRPGDDLDEAVPPAPLAATSSVEAQATCSCGSGIPIQQLMIDGQPVTLIALPLVFQQLKEGGKGADEVSAPQLLEAVRIYNPIPADAEEAYASALLREYAAFCKAEGTAP